MNNNSWMKTSIKASRIDGLLETALSHVGSPCEVCEATIEDAQEGPCRERIYQVYVCIAETNGYGIIRLGERTGCPNRPIEIATTLMCNNCRFAKLIDWTTKFAICGYMKWKAEQGD